MEAAPVMRCRSTKKLPKTAVMRCRSTKERPISMHKKYNVLQYASPSMLYYFYYC